MDMIVDTAHGDRVSTYIFDDTADKREDLRKVVLPYADGCTLHVEDDVDVQFSVCVCHSLVFCWSVTLESHRDGMSVCRRRKPLFFESSPTAV